MSATVSSYEAKTHLPALLRRVEAGESITITRHGRKIAELSPAPQSVMSVQEAVQRLRAPYEKAAGKSGRRKSMSRAELHEGHKY